MAEVSNPFDLLFPLAGLILPILYYIVWIAVGVVVLIYLRRELRKP